MPDDRTQDVRPYASSPCYAHEFQSGDQSDEAEQEVIQKAKAYHAKGLSLRKIAAELDKQGIKTRRGSIFAANQISRMVA